MYDDCLIFRRTNKIEFSPGDLMSNVNDELTEVLKEIFNYNELRIIDEFSDVVIYLLNGLEQLGHDAKSNIERAGDNAMTDKHPTPTQGVAAIYMALAHYLVKKDVKALALAANVALSAIDALGYHAVAVVTEKVKCINSREGAFNFQLAKWQKNPDQDPLTIYKPRYEQCRK